MPVPNNEVKAALVAHYQGISAITSLLEGGAKGVKEAQYQGSDFTYPALRVQITRQTPDLDAEQCEIWRLIANARCYAEGPSSKPADELSGVVAANTHKKKLKGGTLGVDAFYIPRMYVTGHLAAVRLTERLWRTEVLIEGNLYLSDEMGGS